MEYVIKFTDSYPNSKNLIAWWVKAVEFDHINDSLNTDKLLVHPLFFKEKNVIQY